MFAIARHCRPLLLVLLLAVAACGFTLRGATEVPFDTLAINVPLNSEFGAQLRRRMEASAPGLRVVPASQPAEVQLEVLEVHANASRHPSTRKVESRNTN